MQKRVIYVTLLLGDTVLELLEKLDAVKKELDQVACIKKLKKSQEELLGNSLLYKKIRNHEEDLEMYDEVIEYRKAENEVNFLILEIRKYLKEHLNDEGGCFYESH